MAALSETFGAEGAVAEDEDGDGTRRAEIAGESEKPISTTDFETIGAQCESESGGTETGTRLHEVDGVHREGLGPQLGEIETSTTPETRR